MTFRILSDNKVLLERFDELLLAKDLCDLYNWDFACSKSNTAMQEEDILLTEELMTVDVKSEWKELSENYDLIFSLHCKQLFPAELVQAVKCINVHPDLPASFPIPHGTGAKSHDIAPELCGIAPKSRGIEAM